MHARPCGDIPDDSHCLAAGVPGELLEDAVGFGLDKAGGLPTEEVGVGRRRASGFVRIEHMPDHFRPAARLPSWLRADRQHCTSRLAKEGGLPTVASIEGRPEPRRTALHERRRRPLRVLHAHTPEPVWTRTTCPRL